MDCIAYMMQQALPAHTCKPADPKPSGPMRSARTPGLLNSMTPYPWPSSVPLVTQKPLARSCDDEPEEVWVDIQGL